jgi:hypothetical protein
METEARSPRRASAGRDPQTFPTQLLLSRCSALRVPLGTRVPSLEIASNGEHPNCAKSER